MSTRLVNKHVVVLTSLVGIFLTTLSMPALADAAADYNGAGYACVGCHGTPPGTGTYPFTIAQLRAKYPNASDLEKYIAANMPKFNPVKCTGTCAKQMAVYLMPPAPAGPNASPVAIVNGSTISPTIGVVPLDVAFSMAGSDDHGIVSYAWNFGDGTKGGGKSTEHHIYTKEGTYTATLTVTDAHGLTNSASWKIYAVKVHTPPVINTSKSSSLSGVSPLTVKFDASLSTCIGVCRSFSWKFADLSISGATTTYTFNTVGTHKVNLTVTDQNGSSAPPSSSTTTLTVTVTTSPNAPVANATKSLNVKGAVPLTTTFDASLSNCANSCGDYAWNFGDGTTASGISPTISHAYQKAGDYTATLTVTDKSNNKKHSTTLAVKVVPAESLTSYVQACQTQLDFPNISIPDMNCYDGDLFATAADFNKNSQVNDFMGYRKITDQVDLTFACRWLFGDKVDNPGAPISIEMLLHNRQNGNTCFFSAKSKVSGHPNLTSATIVSPTGPNASAFWDSPASIDAKVRCVGCHVSGPYIATPTIAPFLAKYGLLNNGHDTLSNVSIADLATPNKNVKYHAVSAMVNGVPGAFSQWDSLKQSFINPNDSGCAVGCHLVGTFSPQGDIGDTQRNGLTVILENPAGEMLEINHAGVMKPYDDWSDYRWINLDTAGDGIESETFAAANDATTTLVPKLFGAENGNCPQPNVPNVMEAHVVGSDNQFLIAQPGRFAFLPDRMSVFNLKQGLVCLNADQESGKTCRDYTVSYECTDANGSKSWVSSPNHALKSDGDHEERPTSVCPAGSTATSIKASYVEKANGWTYGSNGPNDKLSSFSQYGLTCNNADQPDGQCSNYVVRYSSCSAPPATVSRTLTNVFAVGKQVTAASNSLVKGQAHNNAWTSQLWVIEPVKNTEYVRVKNGNVYLNVSSTTDGTAVGTASSNNSANQKWLIEPISNSTDVRLKNVLSGKYLTMADLKNYPNTPDYLPIFSQGLNTSWTSQRWTVQ